MLVFRHNKNNSRQEEVTEQGEGGMAKYSCVALEILRVEGVCF